MPEQILLVDDDRNILDGYRRNLRGEFLIDIAQSGQEALGLVDGKGPYAVVISDMRMPGMDGIELLRRVKVRISGNSAGHVDRQRRDRDRHRGNQ